MTSSFRKEYRPWLDNVAFAPPPPPPSAPLVNKPASVPPATAGGMRYAERSWLEPVRLDSTPPTFRELEVPPPSTRVVTITPRRAWLAALVVASLIGCVYRVVNRTPGPIDSLDYALPPAADVAPAPRVGRLHADVDGRDALPGTGSVVNYKTVTLVLTAQHVFGSKPVTAPVRDLSAVRFDVPGGAVTPERPLFLDGAGPTRGVIAADDVAAFVVAEGERAPALAETLPVAGEALTLALADGRRLTARVVDAMPNRLVYDVDGELGVGADGAPIYDSRGDLAGVHVGVQVVGSKTLAFANPAVAIRAKLAKAIL